MFNLEEETKKWLRSFRKYRAYDEASFFEMEAHLRDHIEDLLSQGYSEKEAFETAVDEFGEVPSVAKEEFWNQKRKYSFKSVLYTTLFKNYYKASLRSMMRNPLSSFINVIGLSAAIGICIFTYSFAQWTYRTDQFHENKDEVLLTTFFANRDGKLQQNGRSPRPLGEAIVNDFPQIDAVCRVQNAHAVVKHDKEVFHERITYADPSYLAFFIFPLKSGNPSSLEDVNSIILSEEKAIKYFGDRDPIGETLLLKFSTDRKKSFIVAGVAKEFPPSLSFDFHFLVHFENIKMTYPDYNANDWSSFVDATFVSLSDTTGINGIASKMDRYKLIQREAKKDWRVESFKFEPLATLNIQSANIRNSISASSEDGYTSIIFLSFVGVFMLALACFNYINIAIVSASKRLKEIGIRKTIGANRMTVIFQFLAENILATSLALGLGVLLGAFVFIPWFESLFYFDMGFRWDDVALWIYLLIILAITAVASGLYPAFYISKFPVTGILKGSLKFGTKNRLTKVILGFQLVLACIFITCAIMFTQNAIYLANRSWGYNENQALYVEIPDLSAYGQLESELSQNKNVFFISGSVDHLGRQSKSTVIELLESEYEATQMRVDANYFETLGIDFIEGRGFIDDAESDKKSIVVNEQFVKVLLPDPIGKTIKIEGDRFTIVGISKDFHSQSFETKVAPTFFSLADPNAFKYLSLKVAEGTQHEVFQELQKNWVAMFPETPFQGGYQEDVWGMYFVEIGIHGKVWRGIAAIAIILAALGLYGLVTLKISRQEKELSIRKVLGARLQHILKTISMQYIMLMMIAMGIGAPASYFLVSFVIDMAYLYHMPLKIDGVVFSVLIVVAILAFVILSQLTKISKSNPVEGLKVE